MDIVEGGSHIVLVHIVLVTDGYESLNVWSSKCSCRGVPDIYSVTTRLESVYAFE